MEFITLKTFDNPVEANIMKARLENEGIHAYIYDENLVSINPLYNLAVGGIRLAVAENDLEKAIEIYNEYKNTNALDENNEIIKCPTCDSENIEPLHKSFKSLKGFLSILSAIAFLVYPPFFKQVKKCRDCKHEF